MAMFMWCFIKNIQINWAIFSYEYWGKSCPVYSENGDKHIKTRPSQWSDYRHIGIMDVFSKYDIYGPQMEKSELSKYEVCKYTQMKLRYVKIIYLYIYINYIYDYWSVKLLSKCFMQYLHVNMSISQPPCGCVKLKHN